MQWGHITSQVFSTQRSVTFNISYPTVCYIILTKVKGAYDVDRALYGDIAVNTYDTKGFTARNCDNTAVGGFYLAIGK